VRLAITNGRLRLNGGRLIRGETSPECCCDDKECDGDAQCGCDFPDKYFEGHGCCQDGQVPKPGTNQCWEDGWEATTTAVVATGVCCNGKCGSPYLPQPDVNGSSPCRKCSVCNGKGFSGGPYPDLLSMLDAYAALGVSWPLSETLCSDGFYFETCEYEGGPGSELKRLLSWLGIKPKAKCKCNERAAEMDRQEAADPGWCERNIDTIVGWLREEAEARGLPFVDAVGRVVVRRAIARAARRIKR